MGLINPEGAGARVWVWNQTPPYRPFTDPTVMERAGWIVEADREKERQTKKGNKPRLKPCPNPFSKNRSMGFVPLDFSKKTVVLSPPSPSFFDEVEV